VIQPDLFAEVPPPVVASKPLEFEGIKRAERAKLCREIAWIVMQGSRPSPSLRDSYLAEAEELEHG
jgi:hypothetical protein